MPARRGIALVALLAVALAYAADDYQLGFEHESEYGHAYESEHVTESVVVRRVACAAAFSSS